MLRFFKTNYSTEQLKMFAFLLSENLRQLRLESNCSTPRDCDICPYSEVCNDLCSLKGYIESLLKGGEQ